MNIKRAMVVYNLLRLLKYCSNRCRKLAEGLSDNTVPFLNYSSF